ncbi:SLAM family member 5-like isoform X2 [Myxocyprinus asiaticus]|uniref:SLAM family member 5-like isoform X2 n=1 Tax=Myxocyprinus asiaticus TaxID=70543 RepID=UPI002222CC1B|nr:SLAM family member 5-like isoform X2 [Myxocyprinus asiaticus]
MTLQSVVLLFIVYIHQVCARDENITGYIGQSVILKSGVDQSWNLTRVQWSIYENTTFIASLNNGKINTDRFWRHKGRLELNPKTGDLTINDLRLDDNMIYSVALVNSNEAREDAEVNLTVQERLMKPDIQKAFNFTKDGQCYIVLKCIPSGENVILSWTPVGVFNGSYISGSPKSKDSILLISFSGNRSVTFNCTASSGQHNESNQITVGCTEENQKPEVCSLCSSCTSMVLLAIVITAVVFGLLYASKDMIKAA